MSGLHNLACSGKRFPFSLERNCRAERGGLLANPVQCPIFPLQSRYLELPGPMHECSDAPKYVQELRGALGCDMGSSFSTAGAGNSLLPPITTHWGEGDAPWIGMGEEGGLMKFPSQIRKVETFEEGTRKLQAFRLSPLISNHVELCLVISQLQQQADGAGGAVCTGALSWESLSISCARES
ncbi:hypothetical protein KIL84_004126 [Mauremys mutica]|uniref:Uncharacterized protein n=1 Tax=Mauremys mutica TaxID=74926 RepID=A0A9D3XJI4_9SAUR|nr:hypothetical protein KIL84_004126 [Mauremys mutica]